MQRLQWSSRVQVRDWLATAVKDALHTDERVQASAFGWLSLSQPGLFVLTQHRLVFVRGDNAVAWNRDQISDVQVNWSASKLKFNYAGKRIAVRMSETTAPFERSLGRDRSSTDNSMSVRPQARVGTPIHSGASTCVTGTGPRGRAG